MAAEAIARLSIDALNGAPAGEARAALAVLFEDAPRFTDRLVAARPFRNADDLFDRALEIALGLPEDEAIELVDAHPRLGAPPATVSAESFREQGYDRPDPARSLADRLAALNDMYERRFGFRYCVFVAGRSRDELIPEWEERLTADRDAELARARRDVVAIARDRHRRLAADEPERR